MKKFQQRRFLDFNFNPQIYKFFKESKIDNLDKLRVSEDFNNAKSAIEIIRKESLINELRIKYTSK